LSTREPKKARKRPKPRPGAVGGVRDLNRQAQTQRLSDAALALYLEHGLGAVTVDQIVAQAGVAKGSFYRYFTDQTALVEALFASIGVALRAAFETAEVRLAAAARPELGAIYLALATDLTAAVAPSPGLLRLYLQECRSPPLGARRPIRVLADDLTHRAVRLSEVAREHGLVRNNNPRVTALVVIGAVERLALGFVAGEDLGRLDVLPATVISVILDGVRAT
jgi:AcrR family transcriptional regulator